MKTYLLFVAILAVCLLSCKKEIKELKLVQEQQSGEYKIAILSETGSITRGKSPFTLEFRKTADNRLVDVGTVSLAPVMEMAGMGPMMATSQVTSSDTPGRYTAIGNLTMAGHWRFNVTFGSGQTVRFNVSSE